MQQFGGYAEQASNYGQQAQGYAQQAQSYNIPGAEAVGGYADQASGYAQQAQNMAGGGMGGLAQQAGNIPGVGQYANQAGDYAQQAQGMFGGGGDQSGATNPSSAFGQARDAAGGFGQNAMSQAQGAMGGIGQQAQDAMGGMGNYGQQAQNAMGGFGQQAQNAMGDLGNMGQGALGQAQGAMGGLGQQAQGAMGAMGGLGQQAQGAMGGLGQQAQGAMGGLGQQAQGAMGAMGGLGQQAQGAMGGLGQQAQGAMGGAMGQASSAMGGLSGMAGNAGNAAQGASRDISGALGGGMGAVGGAATGAMGSAMGALGAARAGPSRPPIKRALLVGCNYPGTNAALKGCINDVETIYNLITTYYGFQPQNITCLLDDQSRLPTKARPTGVEMKNELRALVGDAVPGDVLLFHFSGHGTQVPTTEFNEPDGKDEAICPTDLNIIIDNDIKAIICGVPTGVNFTFIADCCHSGGLLDHAEIQISGDKAQGGRDLSDTSARSLPVDSLAQMLSAQTGTQVSPSNMFGSLGKIFGDGAPSLSGNLLGNLQGQAANLLGGGAAGAAAKKSGGMFSCFKSCMGNSQAAQQAAGNAANNAGASIPGANNIKIPLPSKPHVTSDVGVLITGCQGHETSADARPANKPPHGALTGAINTVLQQNPRVSYMQLVHQVRSTLAREGFAQNPCLECEQVHANEPFLEPHSNSGITSPGQIQLQ